MTRTQFCDSAGLGVLVRAHKQALAEGGELRLVMPADGDEAVLQRPPSALRSLDGRVRAGD